MVDRSVVFRRRCQRHPIAHHPLLLDFEWRSVWGALRYFHRLAVPRGAGTSGGTRTYGVTTMPIIVNLDVMLATRKMRLNDLAAAVDITPQNLSILKTGKAKAIRFSTLE